VRTIDRRELHERRRRRTRKQLARCDRPLLTVHRSSRHIYAQLTDPVTGRTLGGVSTRSPSLHEGLESTKAVEAARRVGVAIAKLAADRSIEQVSFNRNGFLFTGRIKALADAAREAGLKF
jgi:large subunit ribosomal protein L18